MLDKIPTIYYLAKTKANTTIKIITFLSRINVKTIKKDHWKLMQSWSLICWTRVQKMENYRSLFNFPFLHDQQHKLARLASVMFTWPELMSEYWLTNRNRRVAWEPNDANEIELKIKTYNFFHLSLKSIQLMIFKKIETRDFFSPFLQLLHEQESMRSMTTSAVDKKKKKTMMISHISIERLIDEKEKEKLLL